MRSVGRRLLLAAAAVLAVAVPALAGESHTTWPGGAQYLPERVIGRVCHDFDATRLIWEFFKAHPKP